MDQNKKPVSGKLPELHGVPAENGREISSPDFINRLVGAGWKRSEAEAEVEKIRRGDYDEC